MSRRTSDAHRRFLRLLAPGGRLLISDYCRAPAPPNAEFGAYIAQRGYDLHSVEAYGAMLTDAGFEGVVAEDRTWQVRRTKCRVSLAYVSPCTTWRSSESIWHCVQVHVM